MADRTRIKLITPEDRIALLRIGAFVRGYFMMRGVTDPDADSSIAVVSRLADTKDSSDDIDLQLAWKLMAPEQRLTFKCCRRCGSLDTTCRCGEVK